MLFRVLTLTLSVLAALGLLTQLILPAVLGRPLFPAFRRESRLTRAERIRVAAMEARQAAQRETEAAHIAMETEELDSELTNRLTERKSR